jgi:excisionase family DNA binding protein
MAKTFYSTSEVAGMLGVNRVTAYRWIKDGRIKAYGIGKHWKIPCSEVMRIFRESGFSEQQMLDFCGPNGPEAEMSVRKTVLLVGADARLRDSIRRLVRSTPELRSVALETCPDRFEAVLDIGKTAPDIVVWIAADSQTHGPEIAAKIRKVHRKTRVVFFCARDLSSPPAEDRIGKREPALICSDVRGLGRSLLRLVKTGRPGPSWEVQE